MKRLAIITTHPIQYNAPFFRVLTIRQKVSVKVFYTWSQVEHEEKYDPGFDKNVEWDIPLLGGYEYTFVKNIAKKPGSHHFKGIDNPSLIEEIKKWKPDAILVIGWSFKSHLRVLRYFKGKKPVLFRGDSTLLDEKNIFLIKKKLRETFLKWVYQHIDVALYVGKANKQYYLKYGLKESQLVFAPHAVDNQRFDGGAIRTYRHTFKIPDEAIVFLFSGKLEVKKDPSLLVDSFANLNEENTYLLMVGNGKLEKELKDHTDQLPSSIKSRIHFIDFQNQSFMPTVYQSADVFVLPSKGPGETWGLSVNEAMACGLPILISDKSGCYPDLVDEGINGFVFKSKQVDELTHYMKKVAGDKGELKRMGEASKRMIQKWSFESICTAIEDTVNLQTNKTH